MVIPSWVIVLILELVYATQLDCGRGTLDSRCYAYGMCDEQLSATLGHLCLCRHRHLSGRRHHDTTVRPPCSARLRLCAPHTDARPHHDVALGVPQRAGLPEVATVGGSELTGLDAPPMCEGLVARTSEKVVCSVAVYLANAS